MCHWYISRAHGQTLTRSKLQKRNVVAKVDRIGRRRLTARMEGSSWQSDAIVLCVPCHRHPQRPVANPWPGNAGGITMARFTAPVMRALRKMSWHVSSRRRPLGQPAAVRLMPEGLENEDGAWICASGTHENTVGGVGLGLIPSRCGFPRMTFTMKRMSIILERPVT